MPHFLLTSVFDVVGLFTVETVVLTLAVAGYRLTEHRVETAGLTLVVVRYRLTEHRVEIAVLPSVVVRYRLTEQWGCNCFSTRAGLCCCHHRQNIKRNKNIKYNKINIIQILSNTFKSFSVETLCIVALRVSVGGVKLHCHVPSRALPIHFFRHCCRMYRLATEQQTANKLTGINSRLLTSKADFSMKL